MNKKIKYKKILLFLIIIAVAMAAGIVWRSNPQETHNEAKSANSQEKKYTHQTLGFSFAYPNEFAISTFGVAEDEDGETILLQKSDESPNLGAELLSRSVSVGSVGENGFQILITPFDEDVALTEARIRKELPGLAILDVNEILIVGEGKGATQAVVFTSTNSFIGHSREVWFVREKRLYQISAPIDYSVILNQLITSWEFK